MKKIIIFLMTLMTIFQASSVRNKQPTIDPEETITISTRNLLRANSTDEYNFDWDPEANQIEELESPETFDEIFDSIDFATETLTELGSGDECYDYMMEAVDKFRTYVEEGAKEEIISEDYFKDAFEEILEPYKEDDEVETLRARSSAGVNSFNIYWESKRFLWFTVKLPVGFEIKLSASACRKIISVGAGLALDAIITILQAQNFGPKLAVTISLLASLTGNVIIAAAAGILATLATNAIVYFIVKNLLSIAFSYIIDKIIGYTITRGIIIYTYGTTPIRFSYQ